jgi:hypothetical protein
VSVFQAVRERENDGQRERERERARWREREMKRERERERGFRVQGLRTEVRRRGLGVAHKGFGLSTHEWRLLINEGFVSMCGAGFEGWSSAVERA